MLRKRSDTALTLWWITNDATLSVILITAAQFSGLIPTIRKSYHEPYSENIFTWSVNGARYAAMVFIVADYTVTTLTNSIFWAVVDCSMVMFFLIRRAQIKEKRHI